MDTATRRVVVTLGRSVVELLASRACLPPRRWRWGSMVAAHGESGRRPCRGSLVFAAVLFLFVAGRPAAAQVCPGDCGGDGFITVNEIILMVNAALDDSLLGACVAGDINGDGRVTVNEIIQAVRKALEAQEFEVDGTCLMPGLNDARPLLPCPPGTPVKVYRCLERDTCVSDPAARQEVPGQFQVSSDGKFNIPQAADCLGTSTFLFVAEQQSVLNFGPVHQGPNAGRAGDTARQVVISPLTEAAVRLADEHGLANFGSETFEDLLTAVTENTPPETYVGKDPEAAAAAVTLAAQDNERIQTVLARVLQHDLPLEDTSIDPAGDQDFYKFSLNEPTTVLLQVTRSSGQLAPCIEVTGQLPKQCGAAAVRVELTLPRGTYQVFVSDQTNTEVGSYRLYYERLRPEDAVELPIADSETLDVGDLDVFTFNVTDCERFVRLMATQRGAPAPPCLELWRFEEAGADRLEMACGGNDVEQIDATLDGGRYLVVVGAHTVTQEGAYTLQLFMGDCHTGPTPAQAAWRHKNFDAGGTAYYPWGSAPNSGQLNVLWHQPDIRSAAVLTADLDNDGILDMVTSDGSALRAYRGSGAALFSVPTAAKLEYIGDLTGDGSPEICLAYRSADAHLKVDVYRADGTLDRTLDRGPSGYDSIIRVVSSIGHYLIVGYEAGYSLSPRGLGVLSYTAGNEVAYYATGGGGLGGTFSVGDTDGDGLPEVALPWFTPHNGANANGTTDGDLYGLVLKVNLGTTPVTLAPLFVRPVNSWNPSTNPNGFLSTMMPDLDGNGVPEMLFLESHDRTYYPGREHVYRVSSAGNATSVWEGTANEDEDMLRTVVGDLTDDHVRDLVVSPRLRSETVSVVDGATFSTIRSSPGAGSVLGAADVDGDGVEDVLVYQSSTGNLRLLHTADLSEISSINVGGLDPRPRTNEFAISDVTGDGKLEMILSTNGGLYVIESLAQGVPPATPTPSSTPTPTPIAAQSWDMRRDVSQASNPNGPWSFGRKWSVETASFDLFPYRWRNYSAGGVGWYLGGSTWQPSMMDGPQPGQITGVWLWPDVNQNGYPVARWTCPETGVFDVSATFNGAGADVYVVIDGHTEFTGQVTSAARDANFSRQAISLAQGHYMEWVAVNRPGFDWWIGVESVITRRSQP